MVFLRFLPPSQVWKYGSFSIVKAMIDINIIRVHIDNITSTQKFMQFVLKVVEHLPFLWIAAYFRIISTVLFMTYLGTFGLVPIGIFWITLLFIGYHKLQLDMNPLWLISFVSIFLPACFTIKRVSRG